MDRLIFQPDLAVYKLHTPNTASFTFYTLTNGIYNATFLVIT
jgi:hypothetical protein